LVNVPTDTDSIPVLLTPNGSAGKQPTDVNGELASRPAGCGFKTVSFCTVGGSNKHFICCTNCDNITEEGLLKKNVLYF